MSGHAHSHDHGHSHADHAHCQPGHPHRTLQPAVLGWAMVFTLSLVVAEVFGGIFGRSVALLNDSVHNLSDVPALGVCYLAMRWAERPADSEKTYGYHRAGTLAAFTNAFVLVLLSLWLGYEAIQRFRAPVEVVESWMIWTSVAALAVNGGITLALVRGRGDLNLRSILIHNFGDDVACEGGGYSALSLHARSPDMHMDECARLLAAIKAVAARQFHIEHTTVQVGRAGLPAQSGYGMPEPAKK